MCTGSHTSKTIYFNDGVRSLDSGQLSWKGERTRKEHQGISGCWKCSMTLIWCGSMGVYICKIFQVVHSLVMCFNTTPISSVPQSCPTLCDPMNRSTPGLPVHHQLPESTQTHVHRVSDAIQPSHTLSSPSPSALSLSQHQGRFK